MWKNALPIFMHTEYIGVRMLLDFAFQITVLSVLHFRFCFKYVTFLPIYFTFLLFSVNALYILILSFSSFYQLSHNDASWFQSNSGLQLKYGGKEVSAVDPCSQFPKIWTSDMTVKGRGYGQYQVPNQNFD